MSALIKSLKFAQIINRNPAAIYTVARSGKCENWCTSCAQNLANLTATIDYYANEKENMIWIVFFT